MKIRHILVTTDLSEPSLRPCEPIREFARQHGARVTFLHCVPTLIGLPHGAPFAPPIQPPSMDRELESARERLESWRDELAWDDVPVEVALIEGDDVGQRIHEWALQNEVDLIALSTHGHTGLRRLVLGSAAEDILRHSDVPVIAFPMRNA